MTFKQKISSHQNPPVIGITLGDPAGVGPEVIAQALRDPGLRRNTRFVLIGDKTIFQKYFPRPLSHCHFLDLGLLKPDEAKSGKPNRASAAAALGYLQKAVVLLKSKEINALVTGPLSKEATSAVSKKHFRGHTEFLAQAFGIKNFDMMFVSEKLRTVVVTRHIPLTQVSRALTKDKIISTLFLTHQALKNFFRIKQPRIAVCGLNPHAGEGGKIGREEITVITPAIQKAQRQGVAAQGPFPADTIFCPNIAKNFDAIVAMYHDQGIIPVKALCFTDVVNMTIGLPFVRTSPAHGTAFNIAGQGIADPSSMHAAILLAKSLSRS